MSKVLLSCTKELVSSEGIIFTNIEEDFEGVDVVTFECPECKQEHTSNVFGR
jgi:hypothetical protein